MQHIFGSQPKKFQPGRLIPVATVFGSRSDIFFESRPILGRDPEKSLGRDLDRVEVPNTIIFLYMPKKVIFEKSQ
jgi:hypothetical protein